MNTGELKKTRKIKGGTLYYQGSTITKSSAEIVKKKINAKKPKMTVKIYKGKNPVGLVSYHIYAGLLMKK